MDNSSRSYSDSFSSKSKSLQKFFQVDTPQDSAISLAVLILPITISILVTVRSQFKFVNKWILLRGGAEAIKCEIYSYRTNSSNYGEKQRGTLSRDQVLSTRIEAITRQLLQSEIQNRTKKLARLMFLKISRNT